jgi:hypothetical protein
VTGWRWRSTCRRTRQARSCRPGNLGAEQPVGEHALAQTDSLQRGGSTERRERPGRADAGDMVGLSVTKPIRWDTRTAVRLGVPLCPTSCPIGPECPMAEPNLAGIIIRASGSTHPSSWAPRLGANWVPVELQRKATKAETVAGAAKAPILPICRENGVTRAQLWSACHAEGRGFESLQPLQRVPAALRFRRLPVAEGSLCRVHTPMGCMR